VNNILIVFRGAEMRNLNTYGAAKLLKPTHYAPTCARAKQEAGKPSDVDEHTPGSRATAAHRKVTKTLSAPSQIPGIYGADLFRLPLRRTAGEKQNQILTLGLGCVMEGKDLRGRRL
jgi:hypothetical protein